MKSEEESQQKCLTKIITPSEYLEKFFQMRQGLITIEEWQEFSKNILSSFSRKRNNFVNPN